MNLFEHVGQCIRDLRLNYGQGQGLSQEVANACVFLASNLATYTTGQELFVTGGAPPIVRQPEEEYPAAEF